MKLKKDFHHRLFGFAGFSGSGKTTLIEKLIPTLHQYQVGLIKHDAHRFEMDHAGKDTFRFYAAGAAVVFINDPDHHALQVRGESFTLEKEFFKDCSLVIVEGHKYSDHPKFLFLDEEGEAEKEYHAGKITNVLATISTGNEIRVLGELPAFHRNDVEGISSFIEWRVRNSLDKVQLSALVLAGGLSTRMGQDKSLLEYHGKPQARHLYETLTDLGLPAYLSCRKEQDREAFRDLKVINDRFIDFGPLGGILSAMTAHPNKAFLVVACDLPLVTGGHIQQLIEQRDPLKQATAFFNSERKMFEPLFAIYEPQIYSRLIHFLGERMTCPQKVLFNSNIKKLELPRQDFLMNVNTPEEANAVLEGKKA